MSVDVPFKLSDLDDEHLQAGLTSVQVSERVTKYGLNEIPRRTHPWRKIFLRRLMRLMFCFPDEQYQDQLWFTEITAHMCTTDRLGLQARSAVKRNGKFESISNSEIVPGDIVFLRAGCVCPADCYYLDGDPCEAYELISTDERLLYDVPGEGLSDEPYSGRLLFGGSILRQGECIAIVSHTGAHQRFFRAAMDVNEACRKAKGKRERLVLGAVEQYGLVLAYAPQELKNNQEIVLAAVRQRGLALQCAPAEMQNNSSVVLAAIRQNALALKYAAAAPRSIESIVVEAVQRNGMALEYAAEDLKENTSIVSTAVQQNGKALRFASMRMKDDHNIVLAAVQQHAYAIEDASERLKHDQGIVLAAVETNGHVISIVPCDMAEALRHDALQFGMKTSAELQCYAHAMRNPLVVQVEIAHIIDENSFALSVKSLVGESLATVSINEESDKDAAAVQGKIAAAVGYSACLAGLHVVLPNGFRLRDMDLGSCARLRDAISGARM